MASNFKPSPQWDRIHEKWITEEAAADLTNFKSGKRNYKLSLWDPHANGVRYLKEFIHLLASRLPSDDWAKVRRIHGREVGGPVSIRYNGESICLDYLQAVLELGFIEKEVDLRAGRVFEIGAGYGRTCHTMLSNYDLAEYCIVDLPNTMRLSRAYLEKVLTEEQYAKVTFVPALEVGTALGANRFDLCVNVNSMAEMLPETVRAYLELIDRTCSAFYVKNPVGKYLDVSLDRHLEGQEAVRLALESGPLRQVLDIHDNRAVRDAVPAYIAAYTPADAWTCVADGQGVPWSYYWQALYKNSR